MKIVPIITKRTQKELAIEAGSGSCQLLEGKIQVRCVFVRRIQTFKEEGEHVMQ